MRDCEMILEQAERIVQKINRKDDYKQSYGSDVLLTRTEIHLITAIGENPGIGVKNLAQKKGVTDGAISQMVRKLVTNDLVVKKRAAESEAKVELTLTEKGKICFEEHRKYHLQKSKDWYDLFEEMDDKTFETMRELMQKIENIVDN